MPGCKRRLDEDTWLICQSKKSKSNPLSQTVYDSTLAKLRVGARKCFSSETLTPDIPPSDQALTTSLQSSQSLNRVSTAPLDNSSNSQQRETKICSDCRIVRGRNFFMDKCNFCDKPACHLNPCSSCGEEFCYTCYIRRYDDPTTDSFICISCLH